MLTLAMRQDRRSVFWRRTVFWTSALAPVNLATPASAAGDEPALEAGQGANVPPKSHHAYLQYGVALAAEATPSAARATPYWRYARSDLGGAVTE